MDLAIFLKAPAPGKVKTRLCPPLEPLEAADLYTACLGDVLETAARSSAARIHLLAEGPSPAGWLPPSLLQALDRPAGRLRVAEQAEGDLGARLAAAVARAQEEGALPLLILGSDSPDLPAALLQEALSALERDELVLGPAADGGEWCIGLGRRCDALFQEVPWSTGAVDAVLRRRAAALGLGVRVLAEWSDVDEISDLGPLWQRLQDGRSHAPRTHAWLRRWPRRAQLLDPS